MALGKHRDEWKRLAQTRLDDAEVLVKNARYDAAYYLAGYALECAVKARIAGLFLEGYFPPKPKYIQDSVYTHDLDKLHVAAGLKEVFAQESESSDEFRKQWETVGNWSEQSRYDTQDQKTAEDMLEAARGVVECIRQFW